MARCDDGPLPNVVGSERPDDGGALGDVGEGAQIGRKTPELSLGDQKFVHGFIGSDHDETLALKRLDEGAQDRAIAARRFGDQPSGGPGGTFLASWRQNGGEAGDLARLDEERVAWLRALPAMALDGDWLLAHADATFYQVYGRSIGAVNRSIRALLRGDNAADWDLLLDYFSQRRAFQDVERGPARAERFLALYGGRRFVHGHTPIGKLTGQRPESVNGPHVYAGGLVTDVDAGMYLGGRGFVAELPPLAKG